MRFIDPFAQTHKKSEKSFFNLLSIKEAGMELQKKSPLLQKMCERCIERDKKLADCAARRFYCEFYICSEQPKKRKQNLDVSDEKICREVDKMIQKGNTRNTSMIMVASRFELGMPVIRSRYIRLKTIQETTKGSRKLKRVYA
jgi:hypothetical protein